MQLHGFISLSLFAIKVVPFSLLSDIQMGNGAFEGGWLWVIRHIIGRDVLVLKFKGDRFVEGSIDKVTMLQEVHILLLGRVEVILIFTHSYLNN